MGYTDISNTYYSTIPFIGCHKFGKNEHIAAELLSKQYGYKDETINLIAKYILKNNWDLAKEEYRNSKDVYSDTTKKYFEENMGCKIHLIIYCPYCYNH